MLYLKSKLREIKHFKRAQSIRTHINCALLRRKKFPGRKLNFYFLSTGRVGTRFFARVLDTAKNARVFHQPGPQLKKTAVQDVVSTYMRDIENFKKLTVSDFPQLEEKILRQLAIPVPVYGDTLNHMFPFGYMLYKYFGPKRVRLVHLIRHPVPCGRSTIVAEKDWGSGERFTELRPKEYIKANTPAEKAANIWIEVNSMIRKQFALIDDPSVCKVFRLEDVTIDSIRDLFEFLRLEGFDEKKIKPLMGDTSHNVRHSHVKFHDEREVTKEELDIVSRLCAPLAKKYGYDSDAHAGLKKLEND